MSDWENRCRDCDDTGITIQTERRCACQPNPEGMKVAERVLPACNLGCEQNCPADYSTDLCCVTRRAVAAMQEASHTMKFSRVFIGSREKMHPDGQDLYDAALAQLNAALSTLTDTPSHGQEQSQ